MSSVGPVPVQIGDPDVERLAELHVWGFPLVAVHRTRAAHGVGGAMAERPGLATPADRSVVAPNNDTLYGSGFFDLAAGDVTIDVAPMDRPDRYWSVMLLDAYTDVQYVCRRLHGQDGASVRVTFDPARPEGPAPGGDVVRIPTRTVWILVRVLVDGPHDLAAARAARARIHVTQPTPPTPPILNDRADAPRRARPPVRRLGAVRGSRGFFVELAEALAIDPPPPGLPAPPAGALDLLAGRLAGGEGDDDPVLCESGRRGRALLRAAGSGADRIVDGWGTRVRGADFGADVTYRAAFARVSLAGHLPVENRSYSCPVDGRQPVELRFPPGGEPPVGAFWSLTMYGPDLFLVGNAIDRYSIGDRTPDLPRDPDGGLRIVISHDPPADPSGWLPAPDGPGAVVLRAYEGLPSVVSAEWFPPRLEPIGGTR